VNQFAARLVGNCKANGAVTSVQHDLPARDVRLVLVDLCSADEISEQDHRFIKKLTRPMQTFKSLNSASTTLAGIEVTHMIRKGQSGQSGFAQFAALAG